MGGIPLSVITRPNTTTTTTTTTKGVAMKGKSTYYTKNPIIFPSETTKFTIGTLARQQAGLTFANRKVGMTEKNMKFVSSTRKFSTMKVQKKVGMTKMLTTKAMKLKMSTNATVKATVKAIPTPKKVR